MIHQTTLILSALSAFSPAFDVVRDYRGDPVRTQSIAIVVQARPIAGYENLRANFFLCLRKRLGEATGVKQVYDFDVPADSLSRIVNPARSFRAFVPASIPFSYDGYTPSVILFIKRFGAEEPAFSRTNVVMGPNGSIRSRPAKADAANRFSFVWFFYHNEAGRVIGFGEANDRLESPSGPSDADVGRLTAKFCEMVMKSAPHCVTGN